MSTERYQPKPQSIPFHEFVGPLPQEYKDRMRFFKRSEMVQELGKPGRFVDQQLKKEIYSNVEKEWQPSDFLPDNSRPDHLEHIAEFKEKAKGVSDATFVVLIGDAITEEGLPLYMQALNNIAAIKDKTGSDDTPWAKWIRWWTAQENKHGVALNKYLDYSGKINMRLFDITTENLIRNGFNPRLANDPIKGLIYPSLQEEATRVSHVRVGVLGGRQGDPNLQTISANIARDESNHREFYAGSVDQLMKMDPAQVILAFADIMKDGFVMPAARMSDKGDLPGDVRASRLFIRYATVAQRLGIYTARDYENIFNMFMKRWKIADIRGLSGEADRAQEWLGNHSKDLHQFADEREEKLARNKQKLPFGWINGREVNMADPGLVYEQKKAT